jgi:Uma2 family endonuclease
MSIVETLTRPFKPGTTGWTAGDLDDPAIEREWFKGRYEIVEGVLTAMAPAYFAGGNAIANLIYLLKAHSKDHRLRWRFATEADIVVDELRVPRADAVMLTPKDARRQDQAARAVGKTDPKRVRILVPPTLVVESMSPGHEVHDTRTKKAWYADFGVPHYWIVDAYQKTLECFSLSDGKYASTNKGRGNQVLRRLPFPGVAIALREIWEG